MKVRQIMSDGEIDVLEAVAEAIEEQDPGVVFNVLTEILAAIIAAETMGTGTRDRILNYACDRMRWRVEDLCAPTSKQATHPTPAGVM